MGTYALGAHLAEQEGRASVSEASSLINDLRNHGKLKALPIKETNKANGLLIAYDGTELIEYGVPGSGRWVPTGDLEDGTIRYLGSASHAGHIELKALWVLKEGIWYNIITMRPEDTIEQFVI